MRLLVFGGSVFLGRAVVADGLARGWDVTTFSRRGTPIDGVESLRGNRVDPGSLEQVSRRAWDVVVDTWWGPPETVRDSARALAERAQRYVYVSSGSVYVPPPRLGADETAPVVEGGGESYPAVKRGGELAVEETFGDRALIARAGLILGPHENVGPPALVAAAHGPRRRGARPRTGRTAAAGTSTRILEAWRA